MALSMEEQRILAEIENELACCEPALAAYLSAFGPAGRAVVLARPQPRLRSRWVLVVASLVALVLLTAVPVVVYALVSLHALPRGRSAGHPAVPAQHHAVSPQPVMSASR